MSFAEVQKILEYMKKELGAMMDLECKRCVLSMHVGEETEKHKVYRKDYHELLRTYTHLSNRHLSLWDAESGNSETLVPGGRSEITSYLHILPKDVEELIAQQLIHAHPALFPPISRVL